MIGREARSRGFNVQLAGGINPARDLRNGRNFEHLSEDPLLGRQQQLCDIYCSVLYAMLSRDLAAASAFSVPCH